MILKIYTDIHSFTFTAILLIVLVSLKVSGDSENENSENENVQIFRAIQYQQRQSQTLGKYSAPTVLHPVYLKIIKEAGTGSNVRHRDDFKISIGIYARETRERKFTKLESPTSTLTPLNLTLPVYNITITRKKSPEPLIMIKNATLTSTSKSKPSPNSKKDLKRASIPLNVTKSVPNSKKTKLSANRPPPDPILPPTGDVTEEEDEEEEEEEDDTENQRDTEAQGSGSDDSSEEEDDDEERKKPTSKPKPASKPNANPTKKPIKPIPVGINSEIANNSTSLESGQESVEVKGDTGSIEAQDDAAKKKAKKKKKKKKKKANLHFYPAPLGPKAELIVRLDQVHKNVKQIFSAVQGVFTDYVVNRPQINIEVFKKGGSPPYIQHYKDDMESEQKDRSDSNSNYESIWQQHQPPRTWKKKYPKKPKQAEAISKRYLEVCADDEDEDCMEGPGPKPKPPKGNRPRPPHGVSSKFALPYPIYMESTDDEPEYSPFDYLPPLPQRHYSKGEETWVKTWDLSETGLPKLADAEEASQSSKRGRVKAKTKKHKNKS